MSTRLNPYVGPRTFASTDAARFFGREREANELFARVISERLVLFYAPSGAGKSSLINTRLVPQLREKGFAVLPRGRVSGALPTGKIAVDNIFLFNLMLSLDEGQGDAGRFAHCSLQDFLANLISDDGEHYYYDNDDDDETASISSIAPSDNTERPAIARPRRSGISQADESNDMAYPHVLIIDQFEEIFTNHLERWSQRTEFFRQLNQAMLADPYLWIVLALREDYVAALDPYAPLMTDRMRARFYMQRMGYKAALDAIKKPAAAFACPFEPGVAEKLVDNLRRVRMAGSFRDASEPIALAEFIEPVQLQVVCYQLWEKLTATMPPSVVGEGRDLNDTRQLEKTTAAEPEGRSSITEEDIEAFAEVDRALSNFYEQTMATVLAESSAQVSPRTLRNWFSQQLITEAETRGLVYQGETHTGSLPNSVVDQLARRFLVRAEVRSGGTWIELIHDRMVDPILRANRAWALRNLSPLTQSAEAWHASGRNPALLLSPEQWQEAQNQMAADPEAFGDSERGFIEASQIQITTQRALRQRQWLTGITLLIILVGFLIIYGSRILNEIETKRVLDSYYEKTVNWANTGRIEPLRGFNLAGRDLSQIDLSGTADQAGNRGADLTGAQLSDAILTEAKLAYATFSRAQLNQVDLRKADLQGTNLRGADLTKANLRDANLNNAILSGADLSGANLTNVDLRSANLSGAILTRALLPQAQLTGATLTQAILTEANLQEADLQEADLGGADLLDADLQKANLRNTQLNEATQIDERWRLVWTIVNNRDERQRLGGTDLRSANLQGAMLAMAVLREIDWRYVNLSKADLSFADLYKANLSEADLQEANFTVAKLDEATLSSANLHRANLSYASLFRCNLAQADLSFANLQFADLNTANLRGARLQSANLSDADLSGADLRDADLTGAEYNDTTIWPTDFVPEDAGMVRTE